MNSINRGPWPAVFLKHYSEFNQDDKKNISLISKVLKELIEVVGKFYEVGELYVEEYTNLNIRPTSKHVRKMVDTSISINNLRLSFEWFSTLEMALERQRFPECFKRIALRLLRSDFEKTWYYLVMDIKWQAVFSEFNQGKKILDSYHYILVNAPFLNSIQREVIIEDVVNSIVRNSYPRDIKEACQKLGYVSPYKSEIEGYAKKFYQEERPSSEKNSLLAVYDKKNELVNFDKFINWIIQPNVDVFLNFIQILSKHMEEENEKLDLIEYLPDEIQKKILVRVQTLPIGKEKIKEALEYTKSKITDYILNTKFEISDLPQILNLIDHLPKEYQRRYAYYDLGRKFVPGKCLRDPFDKAYHMEDREKRLVFLKEILSNPSIDEEKASCKYPNRIFI